MQGKLSEHIHETHGCQIIYDNNLEGNITITDPNGHSAIIPGECLKTFIGDWLTYKMGGGVLDVEASCTFQRPDTESYT